MRAATSCKRAGELAQLRLPGRVQAGRARGEQQLGLEHEAVAHDAQVGPVAQGLAQLAEELRAVLLELLHLLGQCQGQLLVQAVDLVLLLVDLGLGRGQQLVEIGDLLLEDLGVLPLLGRGTFGRRQPQPRPWRFAGGLLEGRELLAQPPTPLPGPRPPPRRGDPLGCGLGARSRPPPRGRHLLPQPLGFGLRSASAAASPRAPLSSARPWPSSSPSRAAAAARLARSPRAPAPGPCGHHGPRPAHRTGWRPST